MSNIAEPMNTQPTETAQFISLPKAAAQIGIDVRRVRAAIELGQLKAVRLGSQLLISRKSIERLVEAE
jgi:excisionase family DNA binding protein